jgi:protein involved in temperature-dependent protein secretion
VLARLRQERQLAVEAPVNRELAAPAALAGSAASEPEAEPDPALDALLARAGAADASVASLDAAAHALLVREAFEDADPLVERALRAAPADAEAAIHRAVLKGVAGDTAGARSELGRLARGAAGWEASLFAAGFALRDGDDAAALDALRRFRAGAPPGEVTPELAAQIAELEARLRR